MLSTKMLTGVFISRNGRRLDTVQMSDNKKIIKKVKTATEYHTVRNPATSEGPSTAGQCSQ